jgi:predicted SprT family Zn-dependent metalloprotease
MLTVGQIDPTVEDDSRSPNTPKCLVTREPTSVPELIAAAIYAAINRCAALWQEPSLPAQVQLRWSTRLRTALGLCRPQRAQITLNAPRLSAAPELLDEVLCHELAHIVVYQRHGRTAVAHGIEWKALVYAAGFTPTTALSAPGTTPTKERPLPSVTGKPHRLVRHTCPVCHSQRLARRKVPQWRCAPCRAAGLEGRLITEVQVAVP